jgi:hypothetical protein
VILTEECLHRYSRRAAEISPRSTPLATRMRSFEYSLTMPAGLHSGEQEQVERGGPSRGLLPLGCGLYDFLAVMSHAYLLAVGSVRPGAEH